MAGTDWDRTDKDTARLTASQQAQATNHDRDSSVSDRQAQPNENGELVLDCVIESQPPKGPSLQSGQRPLLEAQTTELPPSSG